MTGLATAQGEDFGILDGGTPRCVAGTLMWITGPFLIDFDLAVVAGY